MITLYCVVTDRSVLFDVCACIVKTFRSFEDSIIDKCASLAPLYIIISL